MIADSAVSDGTVAPPSKLIQRPRNTRLIEIGLLALPVLVLLIMGWQRRWMSDDGFIHLRIVNQLLHGNGLVFNKGERVEATTSPAWVLWLAALKFSVLRFVDLPWIAVGCGLAFAGAGLAMAQAGAALVHSRPGRRSALVPAGSLVVASVAGFWDFATSGLEDGMTFAWLGACFWLTAHLATRGHKDRTPRRQWLWAGPLLGLGPLIRPELMLFTIGFAGLVIGLEWRRGRRRRLVWLVAVLAVPAAYQVFRMAYFAALVPNTALAKEAGLSQWSQGLRYIEDFTGTYLLWVPLVCLAVLVTTRYVTDTTDHDWRRVGVVVVPVIIGVIDALFVMRVGGDFMHARMLLPATFAIAMPVSVVSLGLPLRGRYSLSRAATALTCGALILWALPVAAWARPNFPNTNPLRPHTKPDGTLGDERQIKRDGRRGSLVTPHTSVQAARLRQDARTHQRYLDLSYRYFFSQAIFPVAQNAPYGVVVAQEAIGEVSYVVGTDVYVEDQYGLAEPIDSHIRLFRAPHIFRPGHEKLIDLAWVLARFTPPDVDPRLVATPRDVAAARHALQCGQLRVVLRDVHGSLGVSELFRNVADSFGNTRLRFWGFPTVAEHELCR